MKLRLGLACAMLLVSSLTVIPAFSIVLWIPVLLVTEWGHWLALMTVGIGVWMVCTGFGKARVVSACMLLVAAGFFSVPAIEAYGISRTLPIDLTRAFGTMPMADENSSPFDFLKLWHSPTPKDINLRKLNYTTKNGESLALDFYSNDSPGVRPCVIIVHGGSWSSGSQEQLAAWNYILAGSNYRVASIAYRLAPESHWPAQKEDLLAAMAYLKADASSLGIDPTRFVLLGRSAGAQIILAAAYSTQDPSIRGCIASYPPSDMNFDYGPAAEHSLLNAHKVISEYLGGTPEQVPEIYRDASPCQLVGPNSPPTLITQGTRDELVWIENSRKLRDRLLEAHRAVFLLELPWATHGFDLNPSGPGGQLEVYSINWFMKSILH